MHTPSQIQVGKRQYHVSQTTKQGRKTAKAPAGKVYLNEDGKPQFLADWPMRLHGETHYKILAA